MTAVLLFLLPGALQYVDGGDRRYIGHAVLAFVADVVVCHTAWAIVAGWPKRGEWLVSQTLERLCFDYDDKNWTLYCSLAKYINRQSPTRNHIKAVL